MRYASGSLARGSVSNKTVAMAVARLHALVAAGIPVAQALGIAARTPGDAGRLAVRLAGALARGRRLSAALARCGASLDRADLALVEAGESAGALERALALLDARLQERALLRRKAVQTALYPATLLTATVVAVAAMSLLVLPAFAQLYADTGVVLPRSTQVVLGAGRLLADRGPQLGGGCAVALVALAVLRRRSSGLRRRLDAAVLASPVIGSLVETSQRRHTYRALAVLLAAGTDLDRALRLAVPTASNRAFRRQLERAAAHLRRGVPLSTALERYAAARDGSDVALLRIAEATGDYAAAFQRAADAAGVEHERAVERLARIAEPATVVVMAILVGTTVLALYQPLLGSGVLLLGEPAS